MNSVHDTGCGGVLGDLSGFRQEFYRCLTTRADVLFELCDAVLCADGPVSTLVGLSLVAEHRRGHGGLYDGLAAGRVEVARLRRTLAGLAVPRDRHGRITLAVDVSPWLRPDAATSDDRSFCHVYGRGRGSAQMIPGWPYSFVAALEPGATSWCALLDVQRIGRDDDATAVTAGQVRDVVARLIAAGHHRPGDAPITIVFDAGYDICRLAWLLADLPVELVGRVRSDRVFCFPATARAGTGRPPRHGPVFSLADPATHPAPAVATSTDTTRYGTAAAAAWSWLHPRLVHQGRWAGHDGELPLIEGSLIRLSVDRLPGDRNPKPLWLWTSRTDLSAQEVDRYWQVFLRRFDLEHTFRFLKQTLGWTRPRIRTSEQGDRWTWLILAAHTQLRLARGLTADLRRPWEKPVTDPHRLTPARVRRGFRHLRRKTPCPASAPKPSRPGPGRPPGSKNRSIAPHPDVGKTRVAPAQPGPHG
jgi:DDE superfamily endonuclease